MKIGRFEIDKIYNEDSYKAIKDLPDNSIDCIYTDVPYLYSSAGTVVDNNANPLSQRIQKIQNIGLAKIRDGIDYNILDDFVRVMKKTNIFIWCSKLQILDIMNYFNKLNCMFDILVWCKDNPTPMTNNVWLPDLEYCLYFRETGVKLNDGYDLKSKWYSSPINKRDKDKFQHPTIKPCNLVERHIKHATQPNDIIADFFVGSGTTAIACQNTNRHFIGFEIEKKWYDIANDRLNCVDANGQISFLLK